MSIDADKVSWKMTPRKGNVTEILRPGKRGRWQSEQVSQRGCDLMKCRGGFSALQFKVDMSPVAAGGRGFAHVPSAKTPATEDSERKLPRCTFRAGPPSIPSRESNELP